MLRDRGDGDRTFASEVRGDIRVRPPRVSSSSRKITSPTAQPRLFFSKDWRLFELGLGLTVGFGV